MAGFGDMPAKPGMSPDAQAMQSKMQQVKASNPAAFSQTKPTGTMAAPAGQPTLGDMPPAGSHWAGGEGPPPPPGAGAALGGLGAQVAGGLMGGVPPRPPPRPMMGQALGGFGAQAAGGLLGGQGPMVSAPPPPTPPPAPLVNKGYGALPPMPNSFESGPYAHTAGTQWEGRGRAMSAGQPGRTPPGAMAGAARPSMASRAMGGRGTRRGT